ncbi:MAG: leucine-rich repeat domain-containing protein [Clostridia bacterium]|nr:leucine-rich repeat domain-containing protein [Clostridia bacterium]
MKKLLCVFLLLAMLTGSSMAETLELPSRDVREIDKLIETIAATTADHIVFDTGSISVSNLEKLHAAFPDRTFEYSMTLLGEKVRSTAEHLTIYPEKVNSQQTFDKLYAGLKFLPNLKSLRSLNSMFTYDQLEMMYALIPDLQLEASIRVNKHTLRMANTAFSTLHSESSTRYSSADMRALKYMHNLLALDIGHNAVDDLSFLYDLPELRVLILADNQITDLTPIASLEHLEYLELFLNPLTDISPLAECKNLIDLHIGFCQIEDFSPLVGLSKLDRLWMSDNPFTEEDVVMLKEALPNCTINTTAGQIAITAEGWRQGHPRYLQIVEMFKNGRYQPFKEIKKK